VLLAEEALQFSFWSRCRINAAFRLLRNAAFMRQRRFKISKCELLEEALSQLLDHAGYATVLPN
jgi:hypothetical protein